MADVWEKDLAQKTLVTADDYVRVVGADNVSYKQQIKFMPSQYVVSSGTDLLAYIKTLGTGTYFVRMDNVSGFPVTGGVVYRIVKTHGVNDARASIIAIPMNATASIYTAFITSASASSISWVSQPTRAEVEVKTKTVTGTTNAVGIIDLGLPVSQNEIVSITSATSGQWCIPAVFGNAQYAKVLTNTASFSVVTNTDVTLTVRYRTFA